MQPWCSDQQAIKAIDAAGCLPATGCRAASQAGKEGDTGHDGHHLQDLQNLYDLQDLKTFKTFKTFNAYATWKDRHNGQDETLLQCR